MEGIIVKNISNIYTVKCKNGRYDCTARGKFKYDKITPVVGDHVLINIDNKIITDIHKRKNYLIRPSVANVDIAFIMVPVIPKIDLVLLDKLITIISYNNIEPVICFTKADLLNDLSTVNNYLNYYNKIGYKSLFNSNLDYIKDIIKGKTVIFAGQSGSGKSTLLNTLDSSLELKTNEISIALGRGKHTTRHTELYEVCNSFVVDTPGFSAIDFTGMDKRDIRDNFNEMYSNLEFCKYRDCMHDKEDGCRVKKLVEEGTILKERYDNYLYFIRR